MLALVIAAGLCAAWWLLPVGLILWGMMVLSIARQPALRVGHAMESRIPLAPRFQLEWVKLSEQANRAADPIAQREYAQSVSALEARLAKHRQVAAYLDRVDAQLTGLAGNLEGLQAEILSFQALGAASLREQRSRLVEAVRQEGRQLEAFAREGMQ